MDGDEVIGVGLSLRTGEQLLAAYFDTDGIIAAVISLPGLGCAKAALDGKVMSWRASWLWTFEFTKLCPQINRPPATSRTTTIRTPTPLVSRSNNLRDM